MTEPHSSERAGIDEIRARADVPVFNQVSGTSEYYRVQQLLRDRADLLAHYDELTKRAAPTTNPSDAELLALYFRASSNGATADERTANGLRAVFEAGRSGHSGDCDQ